MVIDLLKTLPLATMTTVTTALIAHFSSIWTTFISMFSAGAGSISLIIATIIALIRVACISAAFNTTFIGNDEGSFRVVFNPFSFFHIHSNLYRIYRFLLLRFHKMFFKIFSLKY